VKFRAISLICAALAALTLIPVAHATTLTFEDLDPSPASYDVMPSPYRGFTFMNWFYGPDTTYTPASGTIDLFTDYADPNDPGNLVITKNNAVSRLVDFVFDGAAFSGYSGVTFELWNDGALVHTSETLPDAPGALPYAPIFLSSGYAGLVDKVVISGVQGYFSMDDFTYRESAGTVPEPATHALVLFALATAAGVRCRKIV
jgi:PEP-CTERM motif